MAIFSYFQFSDTSFMIQFQDWSYTGNGGMPSSWYWDFGDGNTSYLQNPAHIYADSGMYQVCLTITDSLGNCTDTYCETIYVGNVFPPEPCYNYFVTDSIDPNTYSATFTGEAFQNGMVVNDFTDFTWDFGDGTTDTGRIVTHIFQGDSLDIYQVCLTTTTIMPGTPDTCISTGCQIIIFDPLPGDDCFNYFTASQDTGLVIYFDGFVNSQFPTIFNWEFGDGNTATGESVSHVYDQEGVYVVTLSTVDSTGCSWTTTQTIYVGGINTFNIFGVVYLDSNLGADQGIVRLMAADSLWQNVIPIDSTDIVGDGSFIFEDVSIDPLMLYYVQAELSDASSYFGQYMPTYHISALTWEYAMPILPVFSWPADIFMIPANGNDGGPGAITGNVTSLGARSKMSGIQIMLMDETMEPLTYTTTDENGMFEIDNLAFGTYVVHAEMIGVYSTQAIIILSDENQESEVNFIVDGNYATLSVSEIQNPNVSGIGEVYPNPVTDRAAIDIELKESITITIKVYNQLGQVIHEDLQGLHKGANKIEISTLNLEAGFYLLNISSDQGDFISKKMFKP